MFFLLKLKLSMKNLHCMKSVRVRSFSDPFFPAFGLNAKIYGLNLRIQFERGEMQTRKIPNTNTIYAVLIISDFKYSRYC